MGSMRTYFYREFYRGSDCSAAAKTRGIQRRESGGPYRTRTYNQLIKSQGKRSGKSRGWMREFFSNMLKEPGSGADLRNYFIEAGEGADQAPFGSEGRVPPLNRRYWPFSRQLKLRQKSRETRRSSNPWTARGHRTIRRESPMWRQRVHRHTGLVVRRSEIRTPTPSRTLAGLIRLF